SNKKKAKSFAPANHEFRPPSGLQQLPLLGRVPVEETPQEKGDFFVKGKRTDFNLFDTNNKSERKVKPSEELNTSISGNREQPVSDLNGTFVIKETITASSKHVNVERDAQQEGQPSLDDNNTKTPLREADSAESVDVNKGNDTENLSSCFLYFTLSRSKKNARKEQQQRLGISRSPSDDIPTKKLRSPFAAMKISQMCKTSEVQLDDTITYVNSGQTPGKSILKKSEDLTREHRDSVDRF
ncbi:hypothetical protein X777_13694, partial [Ooceraea biroi]